MRSILNARGSGACSPRNILKNRSSEIKFRVILECLIDQGRRKVFTTDQAIVNPENYVIKCVGG